MYKGIVLLLLSSFTFSVSTVFAKLVTNLSNIPGVEITFLRFLIGFIIIFVYIIFKKQSLKPKKPIYIILRSIFNIIAVILFFTSVQFTTVTNANMLNMTYPIFVYLFAPFINKEKSPLVYYLYLFLTIIGIYLIINPDINNIYLGDNLALLSSIIAGAAIPVLREARKYDSSSIIIFYLMLIGSISNFFVMLPFFIIPQGIVIIYLFFAAFMGVLGQIFITIGYRYIDAASGSLVSSSRILFAGIMGVIIFSDPLSLEIVVGGILILISLAGISGGWNYISRKINNTKISEI